MIKITGYFLTIGILLLLLPACKSDSGPGSTPSLVGETTSGDAEPIDGGPKAPGGGDGEPINGLLGSVGGASSSDGGLCTVQFEGVYYHNIPNAGCQEQITARVLGPGTYDLVRDSSCAGAIPESAISPAQIEIAFDSVRGAMLIRHEGKVYIRLSAPPLPSDLPLADRGIAWLTLNMACRGAR